MKHLLLLLLTVITSLEIFAQQSQQNLQQQPQIFQQPNQSQPQISGGPVSGLKPGAPLIQEQAPEFEFKDLPEIEIEEPVAPEFEWWVLLLILLSISLLLGLLIGVLVYYAKRPTNRVIYVKPPHELAFEALENARELMIAEKAKEFTFTLTSIVRAYIEKRFEIQATSETTEEFLYEISMNHNTPLAEFQDKLSNLMEFCDLVKFAKYSIQPPQMEEIFQTSWDFVEQTRPSKLQETAEGTNPETSSNAQDQTAPVNETEPEVKEEAHAGS